jgi:DNA-binding transcriptional LysR family regulator
MELELRHLRAVCAIADAGSLSRASAALGMSQPALTAQLRRIERDLGGPLFLRDHTGARPTPLGSFVVNRARTVLTGMEQLTSEAVRYSRDGHPARVRLGGTTAEPCLKMADLIAAMLPGTDIQLHTEYSPRVLRDLVVSRRLDAAVLIDYPGYEMSPGPAEVAVIAVEPIFLAVWRDHRLAGCEEIDLAQVRNEPVALTPPDGAGWPDMFYAACNELGFSAHVPYNIADGNSLRAMVAERRAICPCQATFTASDDVEVRPIAASPLRLRRLFMWHPDGALARYAPQLERLAREDYAATMQDRPVYLEWLRRRGPILNRPLSDDRGGQQEP